MKINSFYFLLFTGMFLSFNLLAQEQGSFMDSRDGKVYKTVKIGTQTWMAENLAFKAEKGIWNYEKSQSSALGYLYNWETAKTSCPAGWHLPTDSDWIKLLNFLGPATTAGGKLKQAGTGNWQSPNTGASNETGFTALPGGYCSKYSAFSDIGKAGYWWSSTTKSSSFASDWSMYAGNSDLSNYGDNMEIGISVRCIKDGLE